MYADYIRWGTLLIVAALAVGMILPWVAAVRKLVGLDGLEALEAHVDAGAGTARIAGHRRGRTARFEVRPDGIRTEQPRLFGPRLTFVPRAVLGSVSRGRVPIGAPVVEHFAQLMFYAGGGLTVGWFVYALMQDGNALGWVFLAVWVGGLLQVVIHLILVLVRNRQSVAVLVRDRNGALLTGFGFTTPVYVLHPAFTDGAVEETVALLERMCAGGHPPVG
ncbi:MAG: hypothetical protein WB626_11860 [Bacteroidota bacterium]